MVHEWYLPAKTPKGAARDVGRAVEQLRKMRRRRDRDRRAGRPYDHGLDGTERMYERDFHSAIEVYRDFQTGKRRAKTPAASRAKSRTASKSRASKSRASKSRASKPKRKAAGRRVRM